MRKLFSILFVLVILVGCSSYEKEIHTGLEYQYVKALSYFYNGDFVAAEQSLKQISRDYSYRQQAVEAQVLLVWIYYIQDDLILAQSTIESFLRYYVNNEYSDWMRYMDAFISYEQMDSFDRDVTFAKEALIKLYNVMRSSNNTDVRNDAQLRIGVIKHKLAQRELDIAKYYLHRNNYIASINRLQGIVSSYHDTLWVQEALYRLVYSWLALGVSEEAKKYSDILNYNYPKSIWNEKSQILMTEYDSDDEDIDTL